MRTISTIIFVIFIVSVVICFFSCKFYKEERFRNKQVEEFEANRFDIDDVKYSMFKVGSLFVVAEINNMNRGGYLVRIVFYSRKKQDVHIEKVKIGNKLISINHEISIGDSVGKYNLYAGIFPFTNGEGEKLLTIDEDEIFRLSDSKRIPITIYFKTNNTKETITIEMEQYTARDIAWPT